MTEFLDRGRFGTILCQRSPRLYEEVRDRGARTSGTTSSSLRCSRRCSVKMLSEEVPEEMLLLDGIRRHLRDSCADSVAPRLLKFCVTPYSSVLGLAAARKRTHYGHYVYDSLCTSAADSNQYSIGEYQ